MFQNPRIIIYVVVGVLCVLYICMHTEQALSIVFISAILFAGWKLAFEKRYMKQTQKYYKQKNDKVVDVRTYGTFVIDIDEKCWLEFPWPNVKVPEENDIRYSFADVNKKYGPACLAAKVLIKKAENSGYIHEWHVYSSKSCPTSMYIGSTRRIYQLYNGSAKKNNA